MIKTEHKNQTRGLVFLHFLILIKHLSCHFMSNDKYFIIF